MRSFHKQFSSSSSSSSYSGKQRYSSSSSRYWRRFFQQSNTLKVFIHQVRLEWWKPLFRPPKRRPFFLTWMISAFFLDQNYKMATGTEQSLLAPEFSPTPHRTWLEDALLKPLRDTNWRIHTHLEKQVSSKHVIFYQYWVSLQPKVRKNDPRRTLCGQQILIPTR